MTLDNQIEAILFHKAEPVTLKKLALILEKDESEISEALKKLQEKLQDRGLSVVVSGDKVMLGTNPNLSDLISKITKEEVEGEIGKAGLETLSIILYKGPISKKEIDYIRGVNSSYILRNLLIKGLVEKIDMKNERNTFYGSTIDLLSFMGLRSVEDLPEYKKMKDEMENLKLSIENSSNG